MQIAALLVSIVAGVISGASLALMLMIWRKQDKQLAESQSITGQISEKMLGTLPSVERVYEKMVLLLEAAEQDKAPAHVMLYWLWFGADLEFVKDGKITSINEDASRIRELLWARVPHKLVTTLVTYGPDMARGKLTRFFQALLGWHCNRAGRAGDKIDEAGIDSLLRRYRTDLARFERLLDDKTSRTLLGMSEEIPALMLAVDGPVPAAILFLLETTALEQYVESGGFVTYDPKMVEIIRAQITSTCHGCAARG